MVKFSDLVSQYHSIKREIDSAISEVIESAGFIGGEYVRNFEQAYANYIGAKHCVGVANGTDALEIAIESLALPPQSEIIVPGNSFIATAEAVSRSGHRVVFCDCDERLYTLDPNDVTRKITPRTKAIIVVHLYGHPADMGAINKLAKTHGIQVIEDCAQAHGAEYHGRKVGTLGRIAAFSFYPGKNLGAYGDAGAIVTDDDGLALLCRKIANHGRVAKYDHELEGRNSRLDGIQAAILSVKLRHLESWTARRINIARHYRQRIINLPGLVLPNEREWAKHVYHLYVVRTKHRERLRKFLEHREIQTGIHYPIALPKLKPYARCSAAELPMLVNRFDEEVLSLPMGEHLSDEDVEMVSNSIIDYFKTIS